MRPPCPRGSELHGAVCILDRCLINEDQDSHTCSQDAHSKRSQWRVSGDLTTLAIVKTQFKHFYFPKLGISDYSTGAFKASAAVRAPGRAAASQSAAHSQWTHRNWNPPSPLRQRWQLPPAPAHFFDGIPKLTS